MHVPFWQVPWQQSVAVRHPPPCGAHAHTLPAHRPLQQLAACPHMALVPLQGAQAPPTQTALQHC